MRALRLLAVGAALLALAGCSRKSAEENALYQINEQSGVITTKQGLQFNSAEAVGDCMTPEEARRSPGDFSRDRAREIVSCLNQETVRQVTPQLPMMADQYTRLDRISAAGPETTYHQTLLLRAASIRRENLQAAEAQVRRMVCAQAPMRVTLEMGGSFVYRWTDQQGTPIHQFSILAC